MSLPSPACHRPQAASGSPLRSSLADAFDASPIALALVDGDGCILHGNPRLHVLLGQPAGALVGRRLQALMHPDDPPLDLAAPRGTPVGGPAPAAVDGRVLLPGGAVLDVRWQLAPVRDGTGAPDHLLAVLQPAAGPRGTVGQAAAPATVRPGAAGWRQQAIEAADIGTWDLDPATGTLRGDARACALLGLAPDAPVEPEGFRASVHPADRRAVERAVAAALDPRGTGRCDVEFRVVGRADGVERWLAARGRARFDAGQPVRLAGAVVDISARRATDAARRASATRFREMADGVPGAVWVTDATGRVELINRTYRDTFGVDEAALAAGGWQALVHPDDAAGYAQAYLDAFAAQRAYQARARVRRADGAWRWIETRATPRRDPAGAFLGHVGLSADVTDLVASQAALIEADRRKDAFLATLAHELRNPLAPLRTGLALLERLPAGSPTVASTLAMMQRQMAHMTRLVDDLLDVSRISRGKVALRRERVRLADVLQAAIEASRPHIEAGGHAFDCQLPGEVLFIDADAARLSQVVANLLNNAAKYTPPGGHLRLRAHREGPMVVIAVEDDGVGIAPAMLPRVFELFTQAEQTLDRAQGGLGIGLSLVRELVELHGGSVQADSAGLGLGATFTVRLPLPDSRATDRARPGR